MWWLLLSLLSFFGITLCLDTLLDVNIMTRHGSRTPLYYYGSDKHNWSNSLKKTGQLTQSGVDQHKRLGENLKKRYIDELNFLSKDYVRDELDIHSTYSDRTNMSALSLLSGMYPPAKNKKGNFFERTKFQPFVEKMSEDIVLKGNNNCDIYNNFYEGTLYQSEKYKEYKKGADDLIQRANKCFQAEELPEAWNMMAFYDPLIAGIKEYGTYPNDNCEESVWDSITEELIDYYIQYNLLTIPILPGKLMGEPDEDDEKDKENRYNVTLLRKTQAPFYTDILYNLRSAINKDNSTTTVNKFHLYSSHDTNELMAEAGLNIWDGKSIPPYATHQIIELWHSDKFGFYVRWTMNEYIDDVLASSGVPSSNKFVPKDNSNEVGNSQGRMYFETGSRIIHEELKLCNQEARRIWGDILAEDEPIPGCPYSTFVTFVGEVIAEGGGPDLSALESNDLSGSSTVLSESFYKSCYQDPSSADKFSWVVPVFMTIITVSIAVIILLIVVALCKGAFWCKACTRKMGILASNIEKQGFDDYDVEHQISTGTTASSDLENQ